VDALKRLGSVIAAPITALGGAVATARLSGPGAWQTASACLASPPKSWRPRHAFVAKTIWGEDALCTAFAEGASYTGEESVEISLHGSRAAMAELMQAASRAGALPAEPGEFTLRAFLNGQMDLTQAESVRLWTEARADRQLEQARSLSSGRLSQIIQEARKEIEGALAQVEASVDFSEETGPMDRAVFAQRTALAAQRLAAIPTGGGRILRQGARIAIVGAPNAGKSSLMNAVLRADRAIVTAIPGTTRDTIEEELQISGFPCVLVDTAGQRETLDPVEAEGVQRSHRAAAEADILWQLYDPHVEQAPAEEPHGLVVSSKADQGPPFAALAVSAHTGEGIENLLAVTADRLEALAGGPVLALERHAELIGLAIEDLRAAEEASRSPVPDDLLAVHLQAAHRRLGEVIGDSVGPDVLTRIFQDFCIGK
jgi:tRNA modification GTPase